MSDTPLYDYDYTGVLDRDYPVVRVTPAAMKEVWAAPTRPDFSMLGPIRHSAGCMWVSEAFFNAVLFREGYNIAGENMSAMEDTFWPEWDEAWQREIDRYLAILLKDAGFAEFRNEMEWAYDGTTPGGAD